MGLVHSPTRVGRTASPNGIGTGDDGRYESACPRVPRSLGAGLEASGYRTPGIGPAAASTDFATPRWGCGDSGPALRRTPDGRGGWEEKVSGLARTGRKSPGVADPCSPKGISHV